MIENVNYKEKYDRLLILYKDLEKEKNQLNETINEILSDFNFTHEKLEKENICLKKEITNIKSEITYFFEKEQSNYIFLNLIIEKYTNYLELVETLNKNISLSTENIIIDIDEIKISPDLINCNPNEVECYTCMMCNGLVMNPTLCVECEILFCKKCITDDRCQECGKFCKQMTSRLIKNPLENLSICCPNKCDRKILYKDITEHLSEICEKRIKKYTCNICETRFNTCGSKDQKIKDHESFCRNVEVDCIFCNAKFKRRLLNSHMEKCSKRLLNCILCSTIYPADFKKAHDSYYCDMAKFCRMIKERLEKVCLVNFKMND